MECTENKFSVYSLVQCFSVGWDSKVGIVTHHALDGPGIKLQWGGVIFCFCPDWPLAPPSLLYHGYHVFFLGVKWLKQSVDHPPLSSPKVNKTVELYLYSSSEPSWPVLGCTCCQPYDGISTFSVCQYTKMSFSFMVHQMMCSHEAVFQYIDMNE